MKIFLFIIFTLSILIAPRDNGANEKRESDLYEYFWQGILMTESDKMHFKNWKIVTSHKGALGIAQIMPETFRCILIWSGRTDLKQSDIRIKRHNLFAGKWYFSNAYFNEFRDDRCRSISGYNMGYNSKRMNWDYIKKVMKKGQWQWWKGLDKERK